MYTTDDIYFVGQVFRKEFHAGVKPSYDFAMTLLKLGAHPLGLAPRMVESVNLAHLLSAVSARLAMMTMPRNKVLFFQYPNQSRLPLLVNAAKKHSCKVVLMVHDIDEIRGYDNKNYSSLSKADLLIVHTPAMKEWVLERFPNMKCVVLGIFDYLNEEVPEPENWNRENLIFAGNLSKSAFLEELSEVEGDITFSLYGKGTPDRFNHPGKILYKGCVAPEILPGEIAPEGFGLVWDGDSIDACSGNLGRYLQYNAPYKASCYLAAGLPLVVWEKMGIADFIVTNALGVKVASLRELPEVLKKISAADYAAMRKNISEVRKKLNTGYFTSQSVTEALRLLNEEKE